MNLNTKSSRGITLIALVVSIIVLLILAGISIGMLTGENGIINHARNAKMNTIEWSEKEAVLVAYQEVLATSHGDVEEGETFRKALEKELIKNGQRVTVENNGKKITFTETENVYTLNINVGEVEKEEPKETIPLTTSYVGYYADFEADGTIDGIIYADLAKGNTGSGQWVSSDGDYSIPIVEGLKDYYISKTSYEGAFGTNDVLSPTGTGEDRFYVMALTDFTDGGDSYCWYDGALPSYGGEGMSDWEVKTSRAFGTGKSNTSTMIAKWDAKGYGEQDKGSRKDVWGQIKTKVEKGWFVPSKEEWSAFAGELEIKREDCRNLGFGDAWYWSSSQGGDKVVWNPNFLFRMMERHQVDFTRKVRLSTTF